MEPLLTTNVFPLIARRIDVGITFYVVYFSGKNCVVAFMTYFWPSFENPLAMTNKNNVSFNTDLKKTQIPR